MNIFGFELKRKAKSGIASVVPPSNDDGTSIVGSVYGGHYGLVLNPETAIKNENDLVRRYRDTAQYPDCDTAIDEIANEAITADSNSPIASINLDNTKVPAGIKKKICQEFDSVLDLFKFESRGYDIFRQWYIDGKSFYYVILTEDKKSIAEVRYIDPANIKRVKNIETVRTKDGVESKQVKEEYYLYNDGGISDKTSRGIKLSIDSVVHSHSGIIDFGTTMTLSHLHKAIKPVNQLKMMEDALVIYRISRAPERRVFYVDVGNLPKLKAEQYVTDLMNKFRNKIVYDASTGEVRNSRQHLSMMEDFWMPRREGGKGTEITTLQGAQNLGEIEDIVYFQRKLYKSLNIPISRLDSQNTYNSGRASEITREEIKFAKFIDRLRARFATLLIDTLKIQVVSSGIMSADDWETECGGIRVNFGRDNYYSELKNSEMWNNRFQSVSSAEAYIGKYLSVEWVRKNFLMQTEDDIRNIDEQIAKEIKSGLIQSQEPSMMGQIEQPKPETQEQETQDE